MKLDETHAHEEEDVRRLREFAAFGKFSDADLHRLVRASQHLSSSTPWPLIHEQTPADAVFILIGGEAAVYVGDDRIAVLEPGEVIGESVLRRGKLRSATVTATRASEVLRIDRDRLAQLLDEMPALREIMDATAAKHVAVTLPPKPKPDRTKVRASVPTELVEQFEQAADDAGVEVAAALEDALSQWINRNGSK
jgi:CRP/FNR family cyclic AMP-dependent transcriptional regulator